MVKRVTLNEAMNPAALLSVLAGALTPSLAQFASRPQHTFLLLQWAWAQNSECMQAHSARMSKHRQFGQ